MKNRNKKSYNRKKSSRFKYSNDSDDILATNGTLGQLFATLYTGTHVAAVQQNAVDY